MALAPRRESFRHLSERLALSPFYREKLLAAGCVPQDVVSADVLRWLPTSDRLEIAAHADRIVAWKDESEAGGTRLVTSTGTSGRPIQVYRGAADERRFWQLLKEEAASSGPTLESPIRTLFVCSLPEPREYVARSAVGSDSIEIERIALTRLLTDQTSVGQFDVLSGAPPGLLRFAKRSPRSPRSLIYSTALPLPISDYRVLQEQFNVPQLHCYSMAETGPIARWCCDCGGAYHVFPDMVVEELDGFLCVTKLADSVFPLLRYLTTDRGQVMSGVSRCGFSGTTIAELQGRKAVSYDAD